MRYRSLTLLAALAMSASSVLPSDDPWPCQVALCLANPQGPTALAECRPPIERAWKAWARGKRVPDCKRREADGSEGASLRESGTYIDDRVSDPRRTGGCPFVYYATRDKIRYCAFAGVTDEYIEGRLWGRIWYGGPGGVPYIEMLHEDPDHPRPPDGFEATWRVLKADIESKADHAALAYAAWQAAEKRAIAAERDAAARWAVADREARDLAWIEEKAPARLAAGIVERDGASEALRLIEAALPAARAAAESPTATAADKARYAELLASQRREQYRLDRANDEIREMRSHIASIPARRATVERLSADARAAEAAALDLRHAAEDAGRESAAADAAAQPLPIYG